MGIFIRTIYSMKFLTNRRKRLGNKDDYVLFLSNFYNKPIKMKTVISNRNQFLAQNTRSAKPVTTAIFDMVMCCCC